jgi:membrane fusion protein, multidrug efflux system
MKIFPKTVILMLASAVILSCGDREADGRSAATGDWAQERAEETRSASAAVEALEISRGTVLRNIEASGSVRGETEVTVISEAQGRIAEASFELGEFVREGDVLVRVDDTIARLNVDEALGVFESARLDLEATQRRFEAGSASQAELTRARSNANGAQARLEVARKALRDQTVRAPVSGYVASRMSGVSRGNFLERGVPVARIVDLSYLRVEVTVGERELQFLELGASASVTVAACSETPYDAAVFSIAAGADERTGSYPLVVRWENQCDRIRSGMGARVRIAPRRDAEGIIVPGSAIRRDSEGSFVFIAAGVVASQVVERRNVVTGDRLGDRVLILEGLREGELILTSGLSGLVPGQPVAPAVLGRSGDAL